LLLALCAAFSPSHAHALLERSEPSAGAVIAADRSSRRISLWFTEPVQASFNSIAVLDGDNRRVDQLNARTSDEEPSRVDVDVSDLPQGAYLVRWRVISTDTHVVRGSYWFAVGFASAPPPAAQLLGTGKPALSVVEIAARWLGLLALLFLVGTALFRVAVLAPARIGVPAVERLAIAGATGLFLAAHCLLAAAQAEAVAELPVPQALTSTVLDEVLFGSRFAALWWPRLALGTLLGALLYRRSQLRLAALVGLLLLLATSLAGHASGARVAPVLAIAVDALHLAAAALWVGGLLQLCLLLPAALALPRHSRLETLRALVPRVSAVLVPAVFTLFATGLFSAWEQVGTFDALLNTAHGESLLLKLALLVPLLSIAAINLLFIRPGIAAGRERAPLRFLTNVRAEAVLAAALLLPAALLTALPPSSQQAFPEPLEMARLTGDLRVAFRVDPVWVGVSRFQVELSDAQGLAPGDVRRVVLTFTMEGMNMGRTSVTMTPLGDGLYQAEGFYIGMPGMSQVGVAIDRAGVGDRTAVFRVEVPDLNPQQLAGLRAVLGIGGGFPGVAGAPGRADAASLARGRELYDRHCVACHGETGAGNGPAAPSLLPPPSDLTLHARWHSSEQLHWFIAHGVQGTAMIGFADQLDPAERWDLVNHLHLLARAPTATAARPAPVAPSQLIPEPPPDDGAIPGGRLVFGADFDNDLWLLELPDGKPAPLTRLSAKEFASNPAWSPDSRQIAFSYYRLPDNAAIPVPDGLDLYIMNADGSAMRPLLLHEASGTALQYPAWAADGASVYISRAAPGGARSIDSVTVQSGEVSRVVSSAAFPALSPDGRWLAYVRYPTPPDRGESLWFSAPDGSAPQEIIAPSVFAKYYGLRFSPDGKRLLFAAVGRPPGTTGSLPERRRTLFGRIFTFPRAYANGDLWDLWVVDVDGHNLRPVTALSEDMPVATWSPDGRHIAFLGGGSANSAEAGVTIILLGRRGLRRLTTQPGHRGLDWAPPTFDTPRAGSAR
jgi:copper transport protein